MLSIFVSFASVVVHQQVVFAQEAVATLEDECAKNQGNDLDALLCKSVLDLKIKVADLEARMASEEVDEEQTASEDEEIAKDKMSDEVMEEDIDPPLRQMASGIDPHEIQCKTGQTLVFKASNWRPACVNESSIDTLSMRGWIADHDPSHDDLTQMQDDYMMENPQDTDETENTDETMGADQTEEDTDETQETTEDDATKESAGNSTDTKETQQEHSVRLEESMEVGAR